MPLVKVNELLHHATENGYGVAAVNVFNYETIKWVAEAANRERIPVIIQFYPGFDKYIALKHVAAIAKDFAEKSSIFTLGAKLCIPAVVTATILL